MDGGGSIRRQKQVIRVLGIILAANWAVAAVKYITGVLIHSVGLQADGLHSFLDGSSNVIGMAGIWMAMAPPDANHPYGHRKFEFAATLGIGVMIVLGAVNIGSNTLDAYRTGRPVFNTGAGLLVSLVTLAVNAGVVAAERRAGKKLNSPLLLADAQHTMSDVFATLVVMAGLTGAWAGIVWADLAAALVVMAIIVRAAYSVLREASAVLLDEAPIPAAVIEAAALAVDGVLSVADVRSRGPADEIHIDLTIRVDGNLSVAGGHEISHRVEAALLKNIPGAGHVVVHVEPGRKPLD
ncbi:MAG: Ferrous-iron efflux pump FieF [Myxococcota bacterium]|nr:Ferrous-iron efflux pump FieF [Myxococcota bacterium]